MPTEYKPLTLFASYETIAVFSPFVGDDPGPPALHYRETGGTWYSAIEWLPGVPMWCDKRPYIYTWEMGDPTPQMANPPSPPRPNPHYPVDAGGIPVPLGGVNKAVAFFLLPNITYEISVTYPDGTVVSGSIATLDDNPAALGPNYYVSPNGSDTTGDGSFDNPWASPQHAYLSLTEPGVINLMPGTYSQIASDGKSVIYMPNGGLSGQPGKYITFQSYDMNDKAVIDCLGTINYGVTCWVPYVRFRGLVVKETANLGSCFRFNREVNSAGVGNRYPNYLIVEDCEIENWGDSWPCCGIFAANVRGLLVQRNNFFRDRGTISANNYGVMFINAGSSGSRFVYDQQCFDSIVRDCSFVGNMQDWIGGSGQGTNTHIHDNYGEKAKDDGWSFDYWDVCCSVWNNVGNCLPNAVNGIPLGSVVSAAPVGIGPLYVFRNKSYNHRSGSPKCGSRSHGRAYFYHNTFAGGGTGPLAFGNDNQTDDHVYRNNIYDVSTPMSLGASVADPVFEPWKMDFDYNCFSGGVFYLPDPSKTTLGLDYPDTWATQRIGYNFTQFQALAALYPNHLVNTEQHGMATDPMLVDPAGLDFHLLPGSPCSGVAMPVPGLNTPDSPWPEGDYPSIGAVPGTGEPPVTHTLTIEQAEGGTTSLAAGQYTYVEGREVEILAQESEGYLFDHWVVNGEEVTGNPITVAMTSDIVVTPFFEVEAPPVEFTLNISVDGQGTTEPSQDTPRSYTSGTVVPVTALPSAGWQFVRWEEDGVTVGTAQSIDILMDADRNITAVFEEVPVGPDEFVVTISVLGQGSTAPAPGPHKVPADSTYKVTATAATGYKFEHWEGDTVGTNAETTFLVVQNMSVIAVFVEVPEEPPSFPVLLWSLFPFFPWEGPPFPRLTEMTWDKIKGGA